MRLLSFAFTVILVLTTLSTAEARHPRRCRDFNAGPIWNQVNAKRKCPNVCRRVRRRWNGQWKTTIRGKMSVCGCCVKVALPNTRRCVSPNYHHNEARNRWGKNRCRTNCDCDGRRTCSRFHWCQGVSRRPHKINKRAFCARYANIAIAQQRNNLHRRCNFRGPRWSLSRPHHFNWCMRVSPAQANGETRARALSFRRCRPRPAPCRGPYRCWWMNPRIGNKWVPWRGNIQYCYQQNSCGCGGKRSGGGCYKWARCANGKGINFCAMRPHPIRRCRDFNAGPIWNNGHAKRVCPNVCRRARRRWNGQWKTTIRGKMSVCGCCR